MTTNLIRLFIIYKVVVALAILPMWFINFWTTFEVLQAIYNVYEKSRQDYEYKIIRDLLKRSR